MFDRAVALQAAMKLFWERGYEGTSFDDLIAAMGISASSFYNSFGSKEALYCEATRSYLEWSGQWFFAILNDPSIDTRTAFARLFEATAEEFTRGDHPLGCMISLAGTHCPPGMSNIRDMMAEHRAFSESAMAARIKKGMAAGDVPEGHRLRHAGGLLQRGGARACGAGAGWGVAREAGGDRPAGDDCVAGGGQEATVKAWAW